MPGTRPINTSSRVLMHQLLRRVDGKVVNREAESDGAQGKVLDGEERAMTGSLELTRLSGVFPSLTGD